MTRKRSTQSGSSSATAKLINKINKFGKNAINNSFVESNEQKTRMISYDEDDTFVLTTKQKQQLQRNEYLESLTKEQLKIEAKRRGQKTLGTKSELVFFVITDIQTSLFSFSFFSNFVPPSFPLSFSKTKYC